MSRYYSDPARESDTYALPDVEVFHVDAGEWFVDEDGERVDVSDVTDWTDDDGTVLWEVTASGMACEPNAAGWYYWFCFPGCMPEGEPIGPYETEQAAVEAMRGEVES